MWTPADHVCVCVCVVWLGGVHPRALGCCRQGRRRAGVVDCRSPPERHGITVGTIQHCRELFTVLLAMDVAYALTLLHQYIVFRFRGFHGWFKEVQKPPLLLCPTNGGDQCIADSEDHCQALSLRQCGLPEERVRDHLWAATDVVIDNNNVPRVHSSSGRSRNPTGLAKHRRCSSPFSWRLPYQHDP